MVAGKNIPSWIITKHVIYLKKGSIVFRERDRKTERYSALKGRVAIRKGDEELGVIPAGTCCAEIAFLQSSICCAI